MKSRSRHPSRSGRPDRPGRPSKSHKTERSERHDRPVRAERSERSESRKPERAEYRGKKPAFSARSETPRPRIDARRPAHEDRPREDTREAKPAPAPLPTNVQTVIVSADENGMRV